MKERILIGIHNILIGESRLKVFGLVLVITTIYSPLVYLLSEDVGSWVRLMMLLLIVQSVALFAMNGMYRIAIPFWKKSAEVEMLIKEATSRDELKSIFDGELAELRKLSFNLTSGMEVRRLLDMVKVKFEYVD
jgi:hypothetical protein